MLEHLVLSNLNETPEHFTSRKRAEPHCLLEEVSETKSTETNNHATFDLNKLLVDEGDDEKLDPNKPYCLEPKISDWYEQRAKWLEGNPKFSNFIGLNKPRVLLVTGSSPELCENPLVIIIF